MLQEQGYEWKEEAGQREDDPSIPFDSLRTYLSEISKYPILSKEEESQVARNVHRYDDRAASHRLVTSNLRLVVKMAWEYNTPYLNILDLIQEGNMGLVQAARRYDPSKGTRFSTYASFWIRAYILKYIMDLRSIVKIGTTEGQRRLFYTLDKEKKRLEAEGLFPAPQLLASTLHVNVKEVQEMEKRLSCSDISLDTPIYEDSEETLGEMLRTDDNIEETLIEKEKQEILERSVAEFKKTLTDREVFIFEERIVKEDASALREIGDRFGISKERVRQLESRVLKKFSAQFERELRKLDL